MDIEFLAKIIAGNALKEIYTTMGFSVIRE